MVDTRDLKSLAFGRAGSSPALPTNYRIFFDSEDWDNGGGWLEDDEENLW